MGHIVELITELLFGLAKNKPDKMPDNIYYNPCFTVSHPVKKTIARIVATLIIIAVFALLLIIVDADTQILYVIFIILFGVLLILNSFMVRTGMFFASSAVCLGLFVPVVFDFFADHKSDIKRNRFWRLLIIGACSLVLVSIVFLVDKSAYSSQEWKEYLKFNEYTTQFQDINLPEYETYEKEYAELGIDYNDYLLYSSIDHNDPDLFGIDKMQKVKDLQPYKVMNLDEFIVFLLRGYNKIFKEPVIIPFTVVFIYSLLMFVFASKLDIKRSLSVLLSLTFTFFDFFYIYFMHKWMDRTTVSLLFATICIVLFYIEGKTNKIIVGFNAIIAVVLLCVSLNCWNGNFKWNMEKWTNNYKINHEVMDEIYEDKDHIYISRISFPAWKTYYTPYDLIKKGAMSNFCALGDWLANNPLSVRILADYNIVNMYRDVIDNEKAYLIGDGSSLAPVFTYIKEHYNSNAEAYFVKNIGPYDVYSIKTSAVQ